MDLKSKIPDAIVNLIKIVVRAFYCDIHIVTLDILLKMGYISEYAIAKELNLNVEKVKLITNSLCSENFIKYEDRLFKQVKIHTIKNKPNFSKRVYKLRYWYINPNSIVWNINEKIKNIFSKTKIYLPKKESVYFKCPRKVCGKKYSISDLTTLPFNYSTGSFTCNRFLNLKIICGSELKEDENPINCSKLTNTTKSSDHECIKILIQLLAKTNYLLELEKKTN
nr:TATA binding protein of transcription factor IIE [Cryptomonas sp.]